MCISTVYVACVCMLCLWNNVVMLNVLTSCGMCLQVVFIEVYLFMCKVNVESNQKKYKKFSD